MEQVASGDRIVDRYRLVEKIGSGGFGETWRAHDELFDVDVAIKLFFDVDPSQRERYLREARSLARHSKHSGIVSVRDLVVNEDRVFLVMDYVDGIDLNVVIASNGSLDLQSGLRALGSVADALTSLHDAHLLHRDVSPDNIRIRPDGTGVLLDFGSVLATEESLRHTIMVKPGYAPPEQYGDPSKQGPWTDVYSLAATLYHMLTGKVPTDSLQRSFADDLVPPTELGVSVPAAAENALMAALELDWHARTQSVQELMAGLNLQVGPKPEPKPEPEPNVVTPDMMVDDAPQYAQKGANKKSNRRKWVAPAIVLAAVAAVLIVILARGSGGARNESEIDTNREQEASHRPHCEQSAHESGLLRATRGTFDAGCLTQPHSRHPQAGVMRKYEGAQSARQSDQLPVCPWQRLR